MRRTVHKLFWVWDCDREEAWLNEMAAKGLCLVSVGFCRYDFEDCQPGEYKIRMQLLEGRPCRLENQKYIEFLESTGAEQVGSFMRWVYFRKKAKEGDFELFSDNASRVKYLSLIVNLLAVITVLNLCIGLYNVFLAIAFRSPFNFLGLANLALALWGTIEMVRLLKKRRKIQQEGQVFE